MSVEKFDLVARDKKNKTKEFSEISLFYVFKISMPE